ncbi:thioredoxin-like protein [Protomyces lactucae-debilis]|uniref:Thioredoxin-like protein n=1 Tax=Protomyces lactucae-debilis TaxID=2754530 RepID=A0A1Y2FA48_PROLT|nr:thioredoxin-like protein [Protomyces lactucae-debilis]ORY80324.1 thioredoxin-like protein [Protomyces lactucae-debilis]
MSLRLGSTAPNFQAETTQGNIDFHDWIGDSWAIIFSHPADFTPVCTTELGEMARLQPKFKELGVKIIGLSANKLDSHEKWIQDVDDIASVKLGFPIIADHERNVALKYDMIDQQDATNVDEKGIAFTIRSVFFIDPAKKIRTILAYPASVGRNADEILRIITALQYGDKHKVTTPINWKKGDKVIVPPTIKSGSKEIEAYPNVEEVRPYLRYTTKGIDA